MAQVTIYRHIDFVIRCSGLAADETYSAVLYKVGGNTTFTVTGEYADNEHTFTWSHTTTSTMDEGVYYLEIYTTTQSRIVAYPNFARVKRTSLDI